MRLWTLHPKYLDAQGLVAVWREGLLAQAVLRGKTRGYKHHPQLARFRAHPRPTTAIATYLACIFEEAQARGYSFDRTKIGRWSDCDRILETRGQAAYEWEHLRSKLKRRSPERFAQVRKVRRPHHHPLFVMVAGTVREWERVTAAHPKAKPARDGASSGGKRPSKPTPRATSR